jgi:hypothetical protein
MRIRSPAAKAFDAKSQGTINYITLKKIKMETKKINLATMQKKLSRDEMRKIMGGPGETGCKGIISCSEESEGLNCNLVDDPTCVCRHVGNDWYCR